jgi:hypothetical protein
MHSFFSPFFGFYSCAKMNLILKVILSFSFRYSVYKLGVLYYYLLGFPPTFFLTSLLSADK